MKKITQIIMVSLLISGIGLANADNSNLPWGFTWDTTLTECTQYLRLAYPDAEYRIKPYSDTQCIVTCGERQASVSFEAIFSVVGGIDRKVREYQLEDLAGKTLQLESIGIVRLLTERQENRNSEMIDEFYKTYQEFAAAFGGGVAEHSYVTTNVSIDDISRYYVPDINGSIDLDRLRKYSVDQIASLRSYGLFFRSEHAQYRLNVYHIEDMSSDSEKIVGAISILFTRESQKPTTDKIVCFP